MESRKEEIEKIKTAFETTMFMAYMCGQNNKTISPDRNFKTWFEDNKILDSLIRLSQEYASLSPELKDTEVIKESWRKKFKDYNNATLSASNGAADEIFEWFEGKVISILLNDRPEISKYAAQLKEIQREFNELIDVFREKNTQMFSLLKEVTEVFYPVTDGRKEQDQADLLNKIEKLISDKIEVSKVQSMGMELERWSYKGCVADFGVGEENGHSFATLYHIESEVRDKGYATSVLAQAKKHYEAQGKKFGGSVALNDGMRRIYKKLNIEEYK